MAPLSGSVLGERRGYPSRLNKINLAIGDRTIAKLDRTSTVDPHDSSGTADIVDTFSVALVKRVACVHRRSLALKPWSLNSGLAMRRDRRDPLDRSD